MDIRIHDEIGQWGVSARDVMAQLATIDGQEEISVSIHSPGGDMFDGIAIYNALKAHPGKVLVTVEGIAASAASLIAMAGDEIRMPDNTWLMIHNPWGFAAGDSAVFAEAADLFDRYAETTAGIYAKRSGKTVEEIRALQDASTYMDAAQAKELGFCDVIVDPVASIKAFARIPQCMATDCPVAFAQEEPPADPPADDPADNQGDDVPPADPVEPTDPPADEPQGVDPMAQAAEIVELCQLAGQPGRAAAFIREGVTVEQVRGQLAALALQHQAPQGDSTAPYVTEQLKAKAQTNLTVRSLMARNKTEQAVQFITKEK